MPGTSRKAMWIHNLALAFLIVNGTWQTWRAWQQYRKERQVADKDGDGLLTDLIADLEMAKKAVYQVFTDEAERAAVLPIVVEELLDIQYVDDTDVPHTEDDGKKGWPYGLGRIPEGWQR